MRGPEVEGRDGEPRAAAAAAIRALAMALVLAACGEAPPAPAPDPPPPGQIPVFQVDPEWPRLPEEWVMASGLGLWVDHRDHVWISHRQELITPDDLAATGVPGARPAPIVMELDPEGRVLQGWGHPDETDGWPPVLHGLFVDHLDHVWTTARDQEQVFRLTRDGERVLTLGRAGEPGGSHDPERFGRPADIHVDPETNELFVADGYVNRRVVVFDAGTGAYLRHWGAYGDPPDDGVPADPAPSPEAPPAQFNLVHGIAGSRDGLLYVADRSNSRIQVFTREGTFVAERVLRPGPGGAFAVAFSHDPEQTFLYVADGTEHRVRILRRRDLEPVGELGREGPGPGQFGRPHNLAVDSQGNLYVAEADPGWRVQRFLFQGFAPPDG
jgi:DNA-binding beta-propeller fold protein YncE